MQTLLQIYLFTRFLLQIVIPYSLDSFFKLFILYSNNVKYSKIRTKHVFNVRF